MHDSLWCMLHGHVSLCLVSEFQYLPRSRILVRNEEFSPKVCTNAEDRRTITRIHSRSWAGFSIATSKTERDLKAVACQQLELASFISRRSNTRDLARLPRIRNSCRNARNSRGIRARVRRKCTPDLGCMSCTIAPRTYVDVLICASQ